MEKKIILLDKNLNNKIVIFAMRITVFLMILNLLTQNNLASVGATLRKDAVDTPPMDGGATFVMKEETWRSVVGLEGSYEVSYCGKVLSLERTIIRKNGAPLRIPEKLLTPHPNSRGGYPTVQMRLPGIRFAQTVHILVAQAFVPNPDNLPEVNHKDGNVQNPCADNLEWVTHQRNIQHAMDMGLVRRYSGEKNAQAKLKEFQVLEIRERHQNGSRYGELAKVYSVNHKTIESIVLRLTWKHL